MSHQFQCNLLYYESKINLKYSVEIETANIIIINDIKIIKYHSQSLTLTFKVLYYTLFYFEAERFIS
jgi:hypothetical protein